MLYLLGDNYMNENPGALRYTSGPTFGSDSHEQARALALLQAVHELASITQENGKKLDRIISMLKQDTGGGSAGGPATFLKKEQEQ